VHRFHANPQAFKDKLEETKAKDVSQELASIFVEYPRGKTSVFGKIYFLAEKIGGVVPNFKDISGNPEAKVYDLAKCPARFNVKLPPVKPWEKHMTQITVNDWAIFVAIKVIGRVNSQIETSDVFLQIKGEYEFSGEWIPKRV
jgi:hypothetical protein